MAGRGGSDGGGFVAVFLLLLVIGLVVKYIWWFVGAAALVGLFFAGRALARHLEERRELAAEQAYELRRRADRQHRWTLSGDSRAVYGPDGAAAMRALPAADDEEDQRPIATIARTDGELAALVRDRPSCWPQALFVSVLVQRQTPLLPRLRDSELGFTPVHTVPVFSGPELARRLRGLIDDMLLAAQQLENFTLAPAFMAAFGDPGDDSTADPEAIKHIANRLMDYHERLLDISEQCRELAPPSQFADAVSDCARLLDSPLQSYREFITELVEVVESLPKVFEHASGTVHLGAVVLDIDFDERLRKRVFRRLDALARS